MNGRNFLIDTNIALYLLSGNDTIAQLLEGSIVHLSFITELELLGYHGITKQEQHRIRLFLKDCLIHNISSDIKELSIDIRQRNRLKLPDSIIAATALQLEIPFISADSGFKKIPNLSLLFFEVT
jgi:predicted nucleic acid-binding protein